MAWCDTKSCEEVNEVCTYFLVERVIRWEVGDEMSAHLL